MQYLISFFLAAFSFIVSPASYANSSGIPSDPGQCTRGSNPFQDIKDQLSLVESDLQKSLQDIDQKNIDSAKKHAASAWAQFKKTQTSAEAKYRSFPDTLISDFKAFSTDIAVAKKTSDALKTKATTLNKSIDETAATLGCPKAFEAVKVQLLPPDPLSKDLAKKSASYKVYAMGTNGSVQLVKEFNDQPFGDCKGCSRGISLNCQSSGKALPALAPVPKNACDEGLHSGIGIRAVLKDKKVDAEIKNGTNYTLSQSFNALEKIIPPATDSNTAQFFLFKKGTALTAENLVYQVIVTVQ